MSNRMVKRTLILVTILILMLSLATTVYADSGNDTPQGAGMLILLIGIGAILFVGGMVLNSHPDDSGESQ